MQPFRRRLGPAGLAVAVLALILAASAPRAAGVGRPSLRQIARFTGGATAFGSALALGGDVLAVGEPLEVAPASGTVHVYTPGPQGWREAQALTAQDTPDAALVADGGGFGTSLALSGDTLAVGVPQAENGAGVVMVFARNAAGQWVWSATLNGSTLGSATVPVNDFGRAVALGGDTLAVGAPLAAEANSGAVFVFRRNSATGAWSSVRSLVAPLGPRALFGHAVALSGDTLVAGAPLYTLEQGAVQIRERNRGGADAWGLALSQPGPPGGNEYGGSEFGAAVAVAGNTALVGAPTEANSPGTAYLYARDSAGVWAAAGQLVARAMLVEGSAYGQAVALMGTHAIVAAPSVELAGPYGPRGSVFVFEQAGGAWEQRQRLQDSGAVCQSFGSALASDGTRLAAGASDASCGGVAVLWEERYAVALPFAGR